MIPENKRPGGGSPTNFGRTRPKPPFLNGSGGSGRSFDDRAPFHDESDVLQQGHVREGVPFDGDQVGEEAGGDPADVLSIRPKQRRRASEVAERTARARGRGRT